MAHKTLIAGTHYAVAGGRTRVGGVGYTIIKGRTLVGGTGYNLSFQPKPPDTTLSIYCYPEWDESAFEGTQVYVNHVYKGDVSNVQVAAHDTVRIEILDGRGYGSLSIRASTKGCEVITTQATSITVQITSVPAEVQLGLIFQ